MLAVHEGLESLWQQICWWHITVKAVILELAQEFPECRNIETGNRLKNILDQIFLQTRQGFVFIIDEWDCVFRMAKEREDIQKDYLDFLRGLFKGAEYVELAYMTGILPIKKYGEHSAINVLMNILW